MEKGLPMSFTACHSFLHFVFLKRAEPFLFLRRVTII